MRPLSISMLQAQQRYLTSFGTNTSEAANESVLTRGHWLYARQGGLPTPLGQVRPDRWTTKGEQEQGRMWAGTTSFIIQALHSQLAAE